MNGPGRTERLREAYRRISAWDFEGVLDMLHSKVEFVPLEGSPFAGVNRGREGLRAFFEAQAEVFDEWRLEPERVIDHGDRAVVLVRVDIRGRSSGVPVVSRIAHLWTFDGPDAMRIEAFSPVEDAFAAIGVEPPADL